jgi:hypothetical protein
MSLFLDQFLLFESKECWNRSCFSLSFTHITLLSSLKQKPSCRVKETRNTRWFVLKRTNSLHCLFVECVLYGLTADEATPYVNENKNNHRATWPPCLLKLNPYKGHLKSLRPDNERLFFFVKTVLFVVSQSSLILSSDAVALYPLPEIWFLNIFKIAGAK